MVFSQEYDTINQAKKMGFWLKKQKDRSLIERIIKDGKITKDL